MAGVIAVVEDLFFGARLLETAQRFQMALRLVRSPEELVAQARTDRPALVILDLNAEGCRPLEAIRQLRADPDLRDARLLGFFSHVQRDLRAAAEAAGCDEVLPRSAFTAELPEILRRHAAVS